MEDSSRDHDSCMALVQIVMLSNNVATLFEKNSKMIRVLLVMEQVQKNVVTQVLFKLHI